VSLEIRTETEHPSKHSLARFLACELSGSRRDQIQDHLDECPACTSLLAELGQERESFLAKHDRQAFLAAVHKRADQSQTPQVEVTWWQALLKPARLAPAAGLVALLLIVIATFWTTDGGDTRMKGKTIELTYFVMEPEGPKVAPAGRILHPGDRIQFRLTAPAGGFVHIVGIDQDGVVSVYFPLPDKEPEVFPGGSGRPVPGSVILDETLGRERIFVLICSQSIASEQLIKKIKDVPGGTMKLVTSDRVPLELECNQSSLILLKENQ
jgi:putative zinc finger protein